MRCMYEGEGGGGEGPSNATCFMRSTELVHLEERLAFAAAPLRA